MKKIILFLLLTSYLLLPTSLHARSSGFYVGGGYQQPLMFTWKSQSVIAPNPGESIKFLPSFGAYLVGGYDFEREDWLGLAVPVSWSYVKLNKTEWVSLINADAQVIFHLTEPDTKFDPYLGLLAGFNYMTEGKRKDDSASIGPDFGATFGLKYMLSEYASAGSPNIKTLALMFEVPVKVIMFINDYDLSDSSITPVIAVPVKIGLTYTF